MTSSSADDLSREAGELFDSGRRRIFDDVGQRRLHYHLLRLAAAGVGSDEVDDLRELGRLAFADLDVTAQAKRIRERPGAGALAVAIAGVVERADGEAPRSRVMLGAVLGAYAVLGGTVAQNRIPREEIPGAAALGAVGGALVASTLPVVLDGIDRVGLPDYLGPAG